MKRHSLNIFMASAFCLALALVLTLTGNGIKGLMPEKALAADEKQQKTNSPEEGENALNSFLDRSSFSQIINAVAKAKKNADLGTFERAVTEETIKATKTTLDDGTVNVQALYYDKSGAQTGLMSIVFIPYEGGYHADVNYRRIENGKEVMRQFLRSNVTKDFKGFRTSNEYVKSAAVTGKEATIYCAFTDVKEKFVSEKKNVGISVVETVTEYILGSDGQEVKRGSSVCYTTEYEVIEGQKFAKSYCSVCDRNDNQIATYLCIVDTYVENGITNTTWCFAWDGSSFYGSGDGNYDAFAFRFRFEGEKIVFTGSTHDVVFTYGETDGEAPQSEELYGIFHPMKKGEPAKVFEYALYGEYFENVTGGFARFRKDFELERLNSLLAQQLFAVATKTETDPLIYCANVMIIYWNDDGTITVQYNSYDDSEADTTTNHKYEYRIESDGSKKLVRGPVDSVATITTPQNLMVVQNFEADASALAAGDVTMKIVPVCAIGKTTFKKISGDENITIKKNGKMTIAQGTYEPGTVLEFKVKIKAGAGLHALKTKKKVNLKVTIK